MNNIKLSIIVATYCHEKYIEQALRSIMMQKVNFAYEVLIGEDCSPDGTAAVLRGLEAKLPENFQFFYREKNLGEKRNNYELQDRSRGQYIIFLEGDDYWTDPCKLQKQVDFLDANPEYIAVAHAVEVVNAQGEKRTDFVYPQCPREDFTIADFCEGYLCGHTASMMMRNIFRDKMFPLLELDFYFPGDQQKNFMLAGHGKVYSARDVMSAYRYVPEEGTSYSAKRVTPHNLWIRQTCAYKEMYCYALREFANEADICDIEWLYMKCLTVAVRDRMSETYTLSLFFKEFMRCRFKGRVFIRLCIQVLAVIKKRITRGKGDRR